MIPTSAGGLTQHPAAGFDDACCSIHSGGVVLPELIVSSRDD
jgi:hypothetical protein